MTKIERGDKVKDRITGLVGIAVARTIWLNGCVRIVVQTQEVKDGKPTDCSTFDERDLTIVKKAFLEADDEPEYDLPKRKSTGGPMSYEDVKR